MKPLYEVNLEDALKIAQAGALAFARPYKWELVDQSKALNEPCVSLESKRNHFSLWIYSDKMEIEHTSFDECDSTALTYCHAPIECYVAAHNLGYLVPAFQELQFDALKIPVGVISLEATYMKLVEDKKLNPFFYFVWLQSTHDVEGIDVDFAVLIQGKDFVFDESIIERLRSKKKQIYNKAALFEFAKELQA